MVHVRWEKHGGGWRGGEGSNVKGHVGEGTLESWQDQTSPGLWLRPAHGNLHCLPRTPSLLFSSPISPSQLPFTLISGSTPKLRMDPYSISMFSHTDMETLVHRNHVTSLLKKCRATAAHTVPLLILSTDSASRPCLPHLVTHPCSANNLFNYPLRS
jgi:hypothetical protein